MTNELANECQTFYASAIAERFKNDPRGIKILQSFLEIDNEGTILGSRSMNKMSIAKQTEILRAVVGYYVDLMYMSCILEIDSSIGSKNSFYALSSLGTEVLGILLGNDEE